MQENRVSQAGEAASTPLPFQTSPPLRILAVDEDVSIRRFNTKVLVRSGYDVDTAEDGAAGWEALYANGYDLLITDYNVPKVTGLELLERVRGAQMALPVILAADTLPTEEFTRRPWLKPAATLLKPYTAAEILRTVKKVLREVESTVDGPPLTMELNMKDHKTAAAGKPGGAARQYPPNSPCRILVVDEDRDLRLLYSGALAGPGCSVDFAEDGAAGWEALRTNRYDLLITEHVIPTLTGVELVRKVRAARMALPVVMAAGRLPMLELARNPSLQVTATLVKPFAVDALVDTVKSVLRATDTARGQARPRPNP